MKRNHLTDEEYTKLLEYLNCPPHWGPETYIVDLLMRTGMRQGELVRLGPKDFDMDRGVLKIEPLKGSNIRISKFSAEFWNRLAAMVELMEAHGATTFGLLISGSEDIDSQTRQVRRIVGQILAKVFGPDHGFSVHSLRHTYALKCLRHFGGDLLKVRLAMGHRSIQSTELYLQYLKSEDIADDVMEAVSK